MDEMELQLRRTAATKMRIIGVLGIVFGAAVIVAGVAGDMIRPVVIGGIFFVSGVVQLIRAKKHLAGADDPQMSPYDS
ncbi:hypothetical protein [Polyangium sp. y55x31]|uniref:DUF308 domain-containing protein n=1 Tax=Polyangium sp. y55x31 TaxID=3042688 RepID=UPI002482F953|nr:hypothetical protein [Polyangium sp. y55x31]MDI1483466.1 hypothetical protein [Polyangium sp. y55x31]